MMEAWLEPIAYCAIVYVLVDRFFRGLKWVTNILAYRRRLLTERERIMQDEELEPQGAWGVGSDLSSTSKEG